MTLPIETETIVAMYRDQRMTEQQIASQLGYRLRKAGVSQRRTNKRYLHRELKPHIPALMGLMRDMLKRRKAMAEFVVDPRNSDTERVEMAENLVRINKEIKALEVVTRK